MRRPKIHTSGLQAPFLVLALFSGLGCGESATRSPAAATAEAAAGPERRGSAGAATEARDLGDGFVVWESNRSGAWRLWIRTLDRSEPRRLSPEEPGREHCCAHVSPDGEWVAYLSLEGVAGYAAGGAEGELRLIRPDGSDERVAAARARTLFENRAVVWRSSTELVYLDPSRAAVSLDLDSGSTRELLAPDRAWGWLPDATLTHAVTGRADFSPYDADRRFVAARAPLGGCQPYFTHDGRWGFWTAGTGGPINKIDLATREVSPLLAKSDGRISIDHGYVYFPMVSRDSRLLAFAASDHVHDHFQADYEVFVAEIDPVTLDLVGNAVRMTEHPATDRFPDAHLAPLPLGRHRGEAPLQVRFSPGESAGAASTWRFDFGDGDVAQGDEVEHAFVTPGDYEVVATPSNGSAGVELRGRVTVAPAAAPVPVSVSLVDLGAAVIIRFDEEVDAAQPEISFDSGRAVASWSIGSDRRSLIVQPATPVRDFDRLELSGVTDRAQSPNTIPPTVLEVDPPLWPSNRSGLVFLWETGDAANLVLDRNLGTERATALEATAGAKLDHDYAMDLGVGSFSASQTDADYVLERCTATNECAIEAVVTPAEDSPRPFGRLISFGGSRLRDVNFMLAQREDRLLFIPRAGGRGAAATPEIDLGALEPGRASHVVVSYRPGRLAAFIDGERVHDQPIEGGFFHWRKRPLSLGAAADWTDPWSGNLEGVAIYNRFVEADEARENYLRYRDVLAGRSEVPRLVVDATLLEATPTPSLAEITPYREALATSLYRVEQVLEGSFEAARLRVVHWVILDGRATEVVADARGTRRRLVLEPFGDNPQLDSVYLADTLPPAPEPIFYSVSP